MNLNLWGRGLVSAALSGAAGAVGLIVIDPLHFNLLQGGWKDLLAGALVFAIIGAANYLKEHPDPWASNVVAFPRRDSPDKPA